MVKTSVNHRKALREPTAPKLGWVFAGGGARGAYEIGVCNYIFDRVAPELTFPPPVDILSGTSVGALHACALASWADDPRRAMTILASHWESLALGDVIRVDRRRTINMIRALFGRPPRHPSSEESRGGILDPAPLEQLLSSSFDFRRIAQHIAARRLRAVSVTATHVASGSTTIFYQSADTRPLLHPQGRTRARRVTLAPHHAMASAAIPFLFPAVRINGELYCDGSLRQHVPLSPARQLGADALVVINPRSITTASTPMVTTDHERAFPGPLFLLGKTLNALTLDRIDGDIEQLERVNHILDAGTRRYGPTFVSDLNATLDEQSVPGVKPVALLHIHASEDIGRVAATFVRSRAFRARHLGILERTFRHLADGEGQAEADLLSYLLFDGRFTRQLIELGWQDARRQHTEIGRFFATILSDREAPRAA